MENFVISAQIWESDRLFVKLLIFFPQKTIGVAGDSENELKNLAFIIEIYVYLQNTKIILIFNFLLSYM